MEISEEKEGTFGQIVFTGLGRCGSKFGGDAAGLHYDHVNLGISEFHAERICNGLQRMLGSTVWSNHGRHQFPDSRRYENDSCCWTPATFPQHRQQRLSYPDLTKDIYCKQLQSITKEANRL